MDGIRVKIKQINDTLFEHWVIDKTESLFYLQINGSK